MSQVPSPQTPPGIIIRTPGTPAAHTPGTPGFVGRAPTLENLGTYMLQLDNLPSLQFRRLFAPRGNIFRSDHVIKLIYGIVDPDRNLVAQMLNGGDPQVRRAFENIPVSLDMVLPNSSAFSGSSTRAVLLGSNNGAAFPATSSLFAGLVPSSVKQDSVEFIPAIHSRLQAVSLEMSEGEHLSSIHALLGPFNKDTLSEFLKYAAYLSSNNMLNAVQCDGFVRWISNNNNHSTLRAFFSQNLPTINAFARSIFESALRIRDAKVVQILLAFGVDPSPPTRMNGKTPLQLAILRGNMRLVKILLDAGADINVLSTGRQGESALHDAVWVSDEMVELLLNRGAVIDIPGRIHCSRTALQSAAEQGATKLVAFLLNAGADVNAPAVTSLKESNQSIGATVLQCVVAYYSIMRSEQVQVNVQCLVDAGADVNALPYWNPDQYDDENEEEPDTRYGITALQGAIRSGKIEVVQMLLEAGADINAPAAAGPYGGKTALQEAVTKEHIELVQLLLTAGADVNAPATKNRSTGRTALQAAAETGKVELVQILLNYGADVDAPGCSALPFACISKHAEQLLSTLLAAGADVNGELAGRTALHAAAAKGGVAIVQMLLRAGADVNALGCVALSLAAESTHAGQVVPILLAAGANATTEHGSVALVSVAEQGNVDLVKLLLAAGADVNSPHGRSALEMAIFGGYDNVAAVLRSAGAGLNAYRSDFGDTVLSSAVASDDINRIHKLLAAGVRVNEYYPAHTGPDDVWVTNALPMAAENGNNTMIQILLQAGADIDASAITLSEDLEPDERGLLIDPTQDDHDGLGRTALLSAVRNGRDDLVHMLINAGANVNARPQPFGGWTALQAAVKRGNAKLVQILLDAGADVNAPAHTDCGRTALQAAATQGHIELVQLLLKVGAEVNAPAAETCGVTALQGAAIQGQLAIALMLIKAGADPNAPTAKFDGRTALEGAAENGRLDMVQLLLNAKADIGGKYAERARDLALNNGHAVVAGILGRFC